VPSGRVAQVLPMPLLSWSDMIARYPAGHLVTGVHSPDRSHRLELLKNLIEALGIEGEYAIRTGHERSGERTVQVLFARHGDAEQLGEVIKARRSARYPGWSTQRVFGFDKAMVAKIKGVLW
jgi:hypothetical protein